MNPFGLSDYTDHYTQSMIARFAAPFYDNKGQSEVVVVQINDQVLRELNQSWPLSYGAHARFLRQIISYQPKAIFVDFIYSQDRDPKGLNSLKRLLEKYNDPAGNSPVFIADVIRDGQSPLLPELQGDILRSQIHWSGYSSQYPLELSSSDSVSNTPAQDLYKVYCNKASCSDTQWLSDPAPMTLYWGTRTDPIMDHVTDTTECRTYDAGSFGNIAESARLLFTNTFMGLYNSDSLDKATRQSCPYSRYLFAHQLRLRMDTTEELLKDKIVIFGGSFTGIPDFVQSPVHGQIPGMFMHAMAVDNLITLEQDYLKEPEAITSLSVFSWADLIELSLVALLLWFIAFIAKTHWLASLPHKLILFSGIFTVILITAMAMSLLLNYSPVNVIGILLLMTYAISVSGEVESEVITDNQEIQENP
nr:CHASE2 domain-containing protein [Endozoicomonas sp. OPT23]